MRQWGTATSVVIAISRHLPHGRLITQRFQDLPHALHVTLTRSLHYTLPKVSARLVKTVISTLHGHSSIRWGGQGVRPATQGRREVNTRTTMELPVKRVINILHGSSVILILRRIVIYVIRLNIRQPIKPTTTGSGRPARAAIDTRRGRQPHSTMRSHCSPRIIRGIQGVPTVIHPRTTGTREGA